jgi:hypothetical protein
MLKIVPNKSVAERVKALSKQFEANHFKRLAKKKKPKIKTA